jgi:hypothetical protein
MSSPQTVLQCAKCGRPHVRAGGVPSCNAHKRDGTPCGSLRVHGLDVCHRHGGDAPRSKALAARTKTEREARRVMEILGAPIEGLTPTEALLQEVRRTAGHVEWLRHRIVNLTDLDPDNEHFPLIWGTQSETETWVQAAQYPGQDTQEVKGPGVHIWYLMYKGEREHLVRASSAAIKAGIAEVTVRMAQMQVTGVASLWAGLLRDLELTPAQQRLADERVPQVLRQLSEGIPA